MPNWYIWSGATGAGDGTTWANAYVTLQAAMAVKASGDVFFVAHDHVQTQATALTITSPGIETNPCRVYCVNRAGSVPPVAADLRTTAQISTTLTSAFVLTGYISECYGLIISAGTSTGASSLTIAGATTVIRLVNCKLILGGTSATSRIVIGSSAGAIATLENTTVQFGSISQRMNTGSRGVWRNTASAIAGATVPTTLFGFSANGLWHVEAVDLSALVTGKTLVNAPDAFAGQLILKDCKLGVGFGIAGGGSYASAGAIEVVLVRSDHSDTNYRTELHNDSAAQTTETVFVRSGGATDGTTPIAWKIQTSSASYLSRSLPISIWNETVGSAVTVTIEGLRSTGAIPTNAEIWIEVEYLGTSGSPLGLTQSSGVASRLATATSYSAGSGTWGGAGTQFAMSATITPQEKGPISITVCTWIGTTTIFYIDPKPVVT